MSAQQPQHAPVRLLIAELSENAAHKYDSLLRDAGIPTRPEIIDLPMARDKLGEADMMLCNAALPDLDKLLPQLCEKAPHVPIIVINNATATFSAAQGLKLGAADVVEESASSHLVLVVKRELEHVCQNIRLHQTRRALAEAEQRCQLLLESSKAAIAYVHEGMHIHANEGYVKLFGFEEPDDLLGLPLIDLLAADSAKELKAQLKQFRRNEQETTFDFTGKNTAGEAVVGTMTLAASDYEDEHCLQVTLRTASLPAASGGQNSVPDDASREDSTSAAEAKQAPELQLAAHDGEDQVIPTLTNGSAETVTEPVNVSTQNGSASRQVEEVEQTEHTGPEDGATEAAAEETALPADAVVDSESTSDIEPENAAAKQAVSEQPAEKSESQVATSLSDFLQRAEQHKEQHASEFVGVFVAQLDNYSLLQTEYGLAGTESVCRQVGACLEEAVSEPMMPLASSQWATFVTGDSRETAIEQVDGYRKAIEELILEINEKTVRPTVTFGGATLDLDGFDSTALALENTLNAAFSTMQAAMKSDEGNRIELPELVVTEEEFDDEASRVLTLINEAIENQKFLLLFQPIISLRGDSDEHYEVFLRMLDRQGEEMSPGEFLRTAIDNGVAGKIDRWVILQSIKTLSTHRAKGNNTRLTINLTCNSVADPEFIQWLGVAIKAARLPSDAVIFQITERDAATYLRQTREFVEVLTSMHCRASLSRFGLEDEPFEVLKHVPVDFVKLDGSLIDNLNGNPSLKDGITSMIRDLQANGKLTIVPMVESANVLSTLWQAGANYIQGHYLQEPTSTMDYDFSTDD